MQPFKTLLCCGIATACLSTANAQGFLKKVKDAANTVMEKKIDEAVSGGNNNNTNSGTSTGASTSGSKKNNPSNNSGQGLVTTPPDIKENLSTAEAAFRNANYGEARYAVQQAMLGVEMEIGQKVLKSLPETVAGLKKDAAADQVTSTGWGWVGLTIHREYTEGEKQLRITIANNSAWMQAINLFFTNTGYSQTTGGEQKWKQTKVKGNRAVIEYSESSGYKLSVPLGQTSLLVYEGVNFATEQDMMNAANQINIDAIKAQLGEK